VGKVKAYPSEAPLGLTHKHWSSLEKLAREKHSSLLQQFIDYGQKKL